MARKDQLKVNQFDLVVRDMAASVAFYRQLGFTVEDDDPDHVRVDVPGFALELDSDASVPRWNRGWKAGMGILGFEVPTREGVDSLFAELAGSGYSVQQEPFDAPWGRRYAVIEDPDGNAIGLMSAQWRSAASGSPVVPHPTD